MTSLETLATEDRVILELVLGKNKSYSEIAAMLSSSSRRVRRLARKALEALGA